MTQEIKRIHKNISTVTDGQPWYGDSLATHLSGVTGEMAVKKPDKLNHCIAEIVCHIVAWRHFVLEKMKGNDDYEVWDTPLNWRTIAVLSDVEWEVIKNDLLKSREALLTQIEQMQESQLAAVVAGRKYNFRLMLQGIVQHDIYHAGQISMIKRLVG